jgi:hypothetical protein
LAFDYPRSIVVPSKLTYQLVHRHAPRIHDVEDLAICHACVEQTAAVRHAIELRHPLKCIVLVARPKKSRGGAMSDRYHRYSAQSLRSPFGADRSSISVAAIARGNARIKKRRRDELALSTPPTVPRWASLMQRVVPNIWFLGKKHRLLIKLQIIRDLSHLCPPSFKKPFTSYGGKGPNGMAEVPPVKVA